MNKAYRLIWSDINRTWVAVSEIVKARGKRSGGTVLINNISGTGCFLLKTLASSLLMAGMAHAAPPVNALPTGGTVSAGQATLQQTGNTLNINQSTAKAALNWNTFNVGRDATVNFNQPSASSVTLNRVTGGNPSQIFGRINANGQVFLSNGSGIYFAPSASVNVGAFTATTHSITDNDFMAGHYLFNRNGATGSVINDGNISTNDIDGYIALLAPEVRNNGVIIAQLGTVALAAGEAFELQFDGNNLLNNIRVEASTLQALVENGNAVHAPDGLIILSAQAVNSLQGGGIINNTGTLEASGFTNNGGVVRLTASDSISHTGSINVDAAQHSTGNGGTATLIASLDNHDSITQIDGSISARGGDLGGNGGFIETSGANVHIADTARVTTAASMGLSGTWLIDPKDFTIGSAAAGTVTSGTPSGDISGATLSTALGTGNVTILSSQGSTASGSGDINVNDAVTWSANTLTLTAARDININAVIKANGTSILTMNTATTNGADAAVTGGLVKVGLGANGFTGRVDFFQADGITARSGTGFLNINTEAYTVITELGAANSSTSLDLQGMKGTLAGKYALGANINASATNGWNSSAGFAPIGDNNNNFSGSFDGLGHSISNLTIDRPTTDYVGLFGVASNSNIRNIGLVNVDISGKSYVGGLVGQHYGHNGNASISNSYATGSVTGNENGPSEYNIGGLVGCNCGNNGIASISNSYAEVNVSAIGLHLYQVGGLVGGNYGRNSGTASISNSYATGAVEGNNYVGGLVGFSRGDELVLAAESSGFATISNSYATGGVTVWGNNWGGGGGLVGRMQDGVTTVSNSYATGNVVSLLNSSVGGLVGYGKGGDVTVSNSYATGSVTMSVSGTYGGGGLVGLIFSGTFDNVFATGNVTVNGNNVGGLVGYIQSGSISNAFATGNVLGINSVGNLIGGSVSGTVDNVFATGTINRTPGSLIGSGISATNILTPSALGVSTRTYLGGDPSLAGSWNGGTLPTLFDKVTLNGPVSGNLIAWDITNTSGTITLKDGALNKVVNSLTIAKAGTGSDAVNLGTATLNFDPSGYLHSSSGRLNLPNAPTLTMNNGADVYTVITKLGTSTDNGTTGNNTLQGIGHGTMLTGQYVLGLDIDATATATWNGSGSPPVYAGFAPIGVYSDEFTGTFDGLGHTINKLTINRPTTNDVGLFGFAYNSTIRNVGLNHANVHGDDRVGGLVGYNKGSSISNTYVSGSVTGGGRTGGLVGQNYGYGVGSIASITNSNSSAIVVGGNYTGGLVGWNYGNDDGTAIITNSYATGNVKGNSESVGGLVGQNKGDRAGTASISNSYATGSVTGYSDNVGGLVGWNYGYNDGRARITTSYATGDVTGDNIDNVGGLVGQNYGGGGIASISDSYATGNVTGDNIDKVGGLVGQNYGDSFGTAEITTSEATSEVHGRSYVGGLVGYNFANSTNGTASITSSHAFGAVFGAGEGAGGLVGQNLGSVGVASVTSSDASGDVSGLIYVGGLIGRSYATVAGSTHTDTSHASGNVDGNQNVGGLIGRFDTPNGASTGRITDSYATGDVSGSGDVYGGLIGMLAAKETGSLSVTKSYATGNVTDYKRGAGGLVGRIGSYGSSTIDIHEVYASGNVTTTGSLGRATGGLIGWIDDVAGATSTVSIANVRSTGAVTGYAKVGGLVGEIFKNGSSTFTIEKALATGAVTGNSGVGGVVGENTAGAAGLSASFFDTTANPTLQGVGSDAAAVGVTGKTTSQLANLATFQTAGWDIAQNNSVPTGAPRLGWTVNGATTKWVIGAPSIIDLIYTLSPLSGTYTYKGTDYVLGDLWSSSDIFGGSYSGWTLGTDYTFSSGGSTVTGFTNAGVYSNISVNISKSGFQVASSGNRDGSLTIAKANATVTANSDLTKTYTGIAQSVSGFTASGLVHGETESVLTGVTATGATGTNAGDYTSTASGTDGNYSLSFVNGTLRIAKAHLTVTADNQSRLYGEANPTFTETISGFVNNQNLTSSGVTGTATGTSTAGVNTAVGSAIIVASADGFSATNYDFTNLVNGTLIIEAPEPPPPPTTIDPPVVVETPDTTIPPSGGLDLSVNASPIVETSAKSIDMVSGAVGEGGISVSLVRPPSVNESGIITVSVPKEMATAGSGFTFPLPAQIVETAAANVAEIKVTTVNGDALPSWLRYSPETKSFTATAVPDGAFPIEIIVTVNGQSTTIVISERAE